EVNSETDFVAKNPLFREYVDKVMLKAVESKAASIEEFMAEKWNFGQGETVEQALSQQIAIIGEKLSIRRYEKFDKQTPGKLVHYIHGGGRIAVVVDVECENDSAEVVEAGKNIAMQIAALNPKFISKEDVPADFIAKEREILKAQALNDPKDAKKPENIIDKMIEGRLQKEFKEFCLIEQPYVKDGDMSVKQYLDSVGKQVGASIKIASFVRYETGEGLEKREENFADEVNKAING
ncbi:MAG: translation elongation factor Ts, partial [Firmicutes bacterium]|nr:translation elongation factor Ts [Bacillota bacterium]